MAVILFVLLMNFFLSHMMTIIGKGLSWFVIWCLLIGIYQIDKQRDLAGSRKSCSYTSCK